MITHERRSRKQIFSAELIAILSQEDPEFIGIVFHATHMRRQKYRNGSTQLSTPVY